MTTGAARTEGFGWAALGAVTILLSVRMDPLAEQGVPSFAAPGLLPGLLGVLMLLSGSLLVLRRAGPSAPPAVATQTRRLLATLALCLAFSIGLIGRGLPFWLAATLFVTTAILVLQTPPAGRVARAVVSAAAIGISVGVLATLVFQRIFLVQLP